MANTFSPFGFRSFGEREGQAPTMGMETVALISSDTNLYFTGDLVTISSQSIVAGALALPSSGSVLGSAALGIFVGCEYFNPTTQRQEWHPYFPGNIGSSNVGKAYVVTDPEHLWIVQGTTTAVLGTSCVGLNVGYASSLQASGNLTSGMSYVALNSSTVSGTATLPFRIVATYQSYAPPGGFVNGTSSGTEGAQVMVVQGNNWQRNTTTGVST